MDRIANSLPSDYWRLRSWAYKNYCSKRDLHKTFTYSIQLTNGNKEMLVRILLLIALGKVAHKVRVDSLMLASEKMIRKKLVI